MTAAHAPRPLLVAAALALGATLSAPAAARADCPDRPAGAPAAPAAADEEDCTAGDYPIVHPELWKKAADKVVEDALTAAGRKALLEMYRAEISTRPNFVNQTLKRLNDAIKVMEALEAYAAGDQDKLVSMLPPLLAQHAMAAAGVPFYGEIWTTFEIVKLSQEELRHQDCLLNIDLAYYRFLDDTLLQVPDVKKRVNHYLMSYIHGEGLDPSGNRRETNRRYLQCYIDEDPALKAQGLRVDYSDSNPLWRFVQAVQVSANREALATPVDLMLHDFEAKRKIEEGRQKAREYLRRPEYRFLKEMLPALGSYPLFSEKICDLYRRLVEGGPPASESVVLVIDVSGSMNDHGKLDAAQRAARSVIDEVLGSRGPSALVGLGGRAVPAPPAPSTTPGATPTPEFGILAYSGSCGSTFPFTAFSRDPVALGRVIDGLSASGGTPMTPALYQARRRIWNEGSGTSGRIVLLTDGQNDCSESPVEAAKRIFERREEGIPVRPRGETPGGPGPWWARLAPREAVAAQFPAGTPADPSRRAMGITVSTIGFRVNDRQQAELDAIAKAGGGVSLRAEDAGELASAFRTAVGGPPAVAVAVGGGGPIRRSSPTGATLALVLLGLLAVALAGALVVARSRGPAPPTAARVERVDPEATVVLDRGPAIDLPLSVIAPDGTERRVSFRSSPVTIGRGPGSDLILDDPEASRRHARIGLRGGRVWIEDLGSTAGMFVDGRPVEAAEIRAGSEIVLGATRIRVN